MPVSTPSGLVPIEDLREGDFVLTRKGKLSRVTAISLDSVQWLDNQPNENAIVFKIPAGQLGAKMDCYISFWHRVWHKEAWHTAASLGIAKATREEICTDGTDVYRLYNLALEDPEDDFVICGGVKVEAWSGKAPRSMGAIKFSNGAPAMVRVE
jgi:hypothetical protein